MDCKQIEHLTAEYLGGELDAEPQSEFEAHLHTCEDCRTSIAGLRETLDQLHHLASVPMETARERTRALRVVKRRSAPQRLVIAGLKTAAVLALGVYLGRASMARTSAQKGPPASTVAAASLTVHPHWIEKAQGIRVTESRFARRLGLLASISAGN